MESTSGSASNPGALPLSGVPPAAAVAASDMDTIQSHTSHHTGGETLNVNDPPLADQARESESPVVTGQEGAVSQPSGGNPVAAALAAADATRRAAAAAAEDVDRIAQVAAQRSDLQKRELLQQEQAADAGALAMVRRIVADEGASDEEVAALCEHGVQVALNADDFE